MYMYVGGVGKNETPFLSFDNWYLISFCAHFDYVCTTYYYYLNAAIGAAAAAEGVTDSLACC